MTADIETAESTEQDAQCDRCKEASCICEWLPANWEAEAHGAYRVYALKQSARREQEAAA
jgi:hypothetical protein